MPFAPWLWPACGVHARAFCSLALAYLRRNKRLLVETCTAAGNGVLLLKGCRRQWDVASNVSQEGDVYIPGNGMFQVMCHEMVMVMLPVWYGAGNGILPGDVSQEDGG